MSDKSEYPRRYGWWRNELASLGIGVVKNIEKELNNNLKELSDLSENIKQKFIQGYKNPLQL